ncbi:hypothetical protein C2845_PM17G03910 [Panicum miliaceum]|uniref:Uncharacterized protein n=1 Tax=Panicum miliaceum TaxID=4540 RepID=A0A3L6PYX5_PANMI|nr:hypothetical protein C2845_PM17G03910 [Panicum miliaceum]
MSQENGDGEVAGVVNSHGVPEHDHGTTSGGRAVSGAEEDEERGGGQEPFFQCLDQEQISGLVHLDDARAEFPSDDEDGGGGDKIATRQPGAVLNRSWSDIRLTVRGGAARKPPPFRRVNSLPHSLQAPPPNKAPRAWPLPSAASKDDGIGKAGDTGGGGLTTKDQDCRKEFTVNGQLNIAQRGVLLSMDEFERFVGSMPFVKQLMRRSQSQLVPAGAVAKGDEKPPEKKRTRWLRKIKLVASAAGLRSEKDKDKRVVGHRARVAQGAPLWQAGKSSKELTGLYIRQEELSAPLPRQPPPTSTDADRSATPGLAVQLSRRMRRGRSGKDVLPEHVVVPESVFALAEQPDCSIEGHQDDVLDLSWSKSQSMDKTVRFWDMDIKTCLKMFPHNDYGLGPFKLAAFSRLALDFAARAACRRPLILVNEAAANLTSTPPALSRDLSLDPT